jgi:hypothetical protein
MELLTGVVGISVDFCARRWRTALAIKSLLTRHAWLTAPSGPRSRGSSRSDAIASRISAPWRVRNSAPSNSRRSRHSHVTGRRAAASEWIARDRRCAPGGAFRAQHRRRSQARASGSFAAAPGDAVAGHQDLTERDLRSIYEYLARDPSRRTQRRPRPLEDERTRRVARWSRGRIAPRLLAPGHCTGWRGTARMSTNLIVPAAPRWTDCASPP